MLATSGAHALDCGKARTPADKALCADSAAQAADRAMSDSFMRLKGQLDSAQWAALLVDQRAWLAERDGRCAGEGARLAACLGRESEARTRALDGTAPGGTGFPGRLVPTVVAHPGSKSAYAVDVFLYRFADPDTAAGRTLEADDRAIVAGIPRSTDDDSGTFDYSFDRTAKLAYASDKLLSIAVEGFTFTGGAHGESTSDNINIDMRSGRNLTFNDLVRADKKGELYKTCGDQAAAQLKRAMKEGGEDPDKSADARARFKDVADAMPEGVAAITQRLDHWTLRADAATVTYNIDEIGPHAVGSFSCDLPYAQLRPLAKPDFPLP